MLNGWVMPICNPSSGNGSGPARLDRVRRVLDAAEIPHAAEVTPRRGDATRLARQALLAGRGAVAGIGGDATRFETVNGHMSREEIGVPLREGAALGLREAGRGSDFDRSVG